MVSARCDVLHYSAFDLNYSSRSGRVFRGSTSCWKLNLSQTLTGSLHQEIFPSTPSFPRWRKDSPQHDDVLLGWYAVSAFEFLLPFACWPTGFWLCLLCASTDWMNTGNRETSNCFLLCTHRTVSGICLNFTIKHRLKLRFVSATWRNV